ncbi:MAG TPA: tetratricopeptide repeat protein [Gammaproteobacteria bacterium]|nr:tetratricopeptide repeat protein [Gammaproteobacteria bacterium]
MIALAGCASTPQHHNKGKKSAEITMSGAFVDRYKHSDAISAWMFYAIGRISWRNGKYAKTFGDQPYRDTFAEHYDALSLLATYWQQRQAANANPNRDLDKLADLNAASLLDDFVWICLRSPLWLDAPPTLNVPALQDWLARQKTPFRLEIPVIIKDTPEGREVALYPVPRQDVCGLNVDPAAPVTVADAVAKLDAAARLLSGGSLSRRPGMLVREVLGDYRSKLHSDRRYRSFQSVEELRAYTRAHPDEKFSLADHSYATALYLQAYLSEGRQANGDVLDAIAAVRQLAPYYMMPVIESSYLARKRGDYDQALKLNMTALQLARQFPYKRIYLGRIYRGLGRTEIDRKNYAAAREWLNKALKLDPDDAGAKSELKYIEYIQRKAPEGDTKGASAVGRDKN